jgi:hypothetical protein
MNNEKNSPFVPQNTIKYDKIMFVLLLSTTEFKEGAWTHWSYNPDKPAIQGIWIIWWGK